MIDIRNHGGPFGGKNGLGLLLPIFFQTTAPTTNKVGAVWVEMSAAPTGTIYISDLNTPAGVTVVNGDFHLKLSNFAMDIEAASKKRIIIGNQAANPWKVAKGIAGAFPTAAMHRINGSWVSQQIHVWDGAAWVLKGLGNGYLYKEGVNAAMKFGGFYGATGTYEENADHINFANMYGYGTSHTTVTTAAPVDLSNISTLKVDWEGLGDNNSYAYWGVMITSYENPSSFALSGNGIGAAAEGIAMFARRVDQWDVSALSGMYHITLFARDTSSHSVNTTASRLKIYNIQTV